MKTQIVTVWPGGYHPVRKWAIQQGNRPDESYLVSINNWGKTVREALKFNSKKTAINFATQYGIKLTN